MTLENEEVRCIVVRCPNWVGDLIMATSLFECLRMNYRKARIIALTRSYNARIIEGHPCIDLVIPLDDRSLRGIILAAKALYKENADFAVLLPHSIRSWLPVRLARITRIIGYRRGIRSSLVHGPLPERDSWGYAPKPMIEYYLDICRWMGLEMPSPVRPTLKVTQEEHEKAERLLQEYGIGSDEMVIGINPGAKFGSSKCWPPEYFARLADLIEERLHARLLLFVGPGEDEIGYEIMGATNSGLINTGPDRIDLSLLKPMIGRCDLLVTNDTGPRHYATALDRPVVVIMGPTDPRYTQSNLDKTVVVRKDLPCSPCHKKICPTDHECMRSIRPEEVLKAVLNILEQDSA